MDTVHTTLRNCLQRLKVPNTNTCDTPLCMAAVILDLIGKKYEVPRVVNKTLHATLRACLDGLCIPNQSQCDNVDCMAAMLWTEINLIPAYAFENHTETKRTCANSDEDIEDPDDPDGWGKHFSSAGPGTRN